MGISLLHEQLIRRALAALSEVADDCANEPAEKTLMLRFTLMFTFIAAGADPQKKWIWDNFWEEATRAVSERSMNAYIRGTGARAALNGIVREVGYSPDAQFLQHLRHKREKSDADRA